LSSAKAILGEIDMSQLRDPLSVSTMAYFNKNCYYVASVAVRMFGLRAHRLCYDERIGIINSYRRTGIKAEEIRGMNNL